MIKIVVSCQHFFVKDLRAASVADEPAGSALGPCAVPLLREDQVWYRVLLEHSDRRSCQALKTVLEQAEPLSEGWVAV